MRHIRRCPNAATSWSLPTKRTACSMTLWMALPGTCAMRCRMLPSSALPARRTKRKDANTRAVFGDYVRLYDIQRAVEDKATVPIFYESRLAKLALEPDISILSE